MRRFILLVLLAAAAGALGGACGGDDDGTGAADLPDGAAPGDGGALEGATPDPRRDGAAADVDASSADASSDADSGAFYAGDAAPPMTGLPTVGVGRYNKCAIAPGGVLECWGDASNGRLGATNIPDQQSPMVVAAFASSVVIQAVAGERFLCALLQGGAVKCWGVDITGPGNVAAPKDVLLPGAAARLVAGNDHACAIVAGGDVHCWGANDHGQLGVGTTAPSGYFAPARVTLPSPAASIAAGYAHTCAILADGSAQCWGSNSVGQLGVGDVDERPSPTPVVFAGAPTKLAAIAAGIDHTCAVTRTGGVRCWGTNVNGRLGTGSGQPNLRSVGDDLAGLSGVTSIAAGDAHTCVAANGGVLCWGREVNGELGQGTITGTKYVPTTVTGLAGIVEVAAGGVGTCAREANGTLSCWGRNSEGQVGNGKGPIVATPRLLTLPPVASAALGVSNGCFVLKDGSLRCAGRTGAGYTPTAIALGGTATAVATGDDFICAVVDGQPTCWGSDTFECLGNGQSQGSNYSPSPVSPALPEPAIGIDAFDDGVCARTANGVYCWGRNNDDQMVFTTTVVYSPTEALASHADAFELGEEHACALVSGGVTCYGDNLWYQLGKTDATTSAVPTGLGSGVTALSAGYQDTCALVNGGVKCWGRNLDGELGGVSGQPKEPVDIPGLTTGVTRVAATFGGGCALLTGGVVKCWGDSVSAGQGPSTSPVPASVVPGLPADVVEIGAGWGQGWAITSAGAIYVWGYNSWGQLGVGDELRVPRPTVIAL